MNCKKKKIKAKQKKCFCCEQLSMLRPQTKKKMRTAVLDINQKKSKNKIALVASSYSHTPKNNRYFSVF